MIEIISSSIELLFYFLVFVMTASNSTEGSWSCCWDGDRQAYLGDAYSALWLHDSDIKDLNSETIFDQFFMVRDRNNYSHVQVSKEIGQIFLNYKILYQIINLGIRRFENGCDEHRRISRKSSQDIWFFS